MLLSYKLSFLIPISKVAENMKRAQARDAALNGKFYFRNKLSMSSSNGANVEKAEDVEVEEMSIDEIINGRNLQ